MGDITISDRWQAMTRIPRFLVALHDHPWSYSVFALAIGLLFWSLTRDELFLWAAGGAALGALR